MSDEPKKCPRCGAPERPDPDEEVTEPRRTLTDSEILSSMRPTRDIRPPRRLPGVTP